MPDLLDREDEERYNADSAEQSHKNDESDDEGLVVLSILSSGGGLGDRKEAVVDRSDRCHCEDRIGYTSSG